MDDEFDDFSVVDDAAFAKAVEEAERRATQASKASNRHEPSKPTVQATQTASSSAPTTVKQPVPQKINRPTGTSSIIVNKSQKGNPVLTYIKNIPWEYGDIVPDYVVGKTACALFLSLKYHRLHPEYIYGRIKHLGNNYNLRILLVLVDIENHQPPLLELSKTCYINNLTLILSWTSAEAGRYLETYKSLENTAPTLIQEKPKADYTSRMVDVCTAVRSVSKKDAVSLVSNFGSVRAAMNAGKEEIVLIQGWGEKKADRWEKAAREPFRVRKTRGGKGVDEGNEDGRRIGTTTGTRAGDADAVARRLGIGPIILPETTTQRQAITIRDDDDEEEDDEDSILAIREEEREERERNSGKAATGAGHDKIMDALAKLRAAG